MSMTDRRSGVRRHQDAADYANYLKFLNDFKVELLMLAHPELESEDVPASYAIALYNPVDELVRVLSVAAGLNPRLRLEPRFKTLYQNSKWFIDDYSTAQSLTYKTVLQGEPWAARFTAYQKELGDAFRTAGLFKRDNTRERGLTPNPHGDSVALFGPVEYLLATNVIYMALGIDYVIEQYTEYGKNYSMQSLRRVSNHWREFQKAYIKLRQAVEKQGL